VVADTERGRVREVVTSGSRLTGTYLAMNAAATLIAAFGLLENSPAVIIGAMLIAMLFGPLVGIGLALAEADVPLLAQALVAELVGAVLVLAIAYAVGLATRGLPIGSEILSRTSPELLDLLIAFVGGLAGGMTFVATDLAGVMVGVAIATALVPPLTSCGILLARHDPRLAEGAAILFVSNFSAIIAGATLVFVLRGYWTPWSARSRILLPRLIVLALLAVLGVHLYATLNTLIRQTALQAAVRAELTRAVAAIPGDRLAAVTVTPSQGAPVAWVVILAPQPLSAGDKTRLTDLVGRAAGRGVDLQIRTIMGAETTRSDAGSGSGTWPDEEPSDP
jgi:uncharacterized hydrophobic protein (TIGR00271 family)